MGFNELVTLQLTMFSMMLVGLLLRKTNIITEEGKRCLTDLVIYIFLPCNIVKSFMVEFNLDILKSFGVVFVISIINQIFCLVLGKVLYRRLKDSERTVLQYSTISSNAGFLGNPIAESVFGSMGLTYASIFLIPQRIVIWTAGIMYFTEAPDKKTIVKKVITHPCIIAVVVGIIFMLAQIQLPLFVDSTLSAFSKSCTVMAMMAIGTILAEVNFKAFTNLKITLFTILRLVIIPFCMYVGCHLFHIDPLVTGVAVLLSAMPAGTGTALLASKYDRDAPFATKCVVFSTLMSLVTTPIWSLILLQSIK